MGVMGKLRVFVVPEPVVAASSPASVDKESEFSIVTALDKIFL